MLDQLASAIEDGFSRGVRVFHFAGMIGSGKTSLIEETAKRLTARERSVKIFYEPIPKVLTLYLKNPEKYATALQRAFLARRMVVDSDIEVEELENPDTIILVERGCNENTVFVKQNTDCGWISPEDAAEMIVQSEPQCRRERAEEAQVFVTADLETCYRRMLRRGRPGESAAYTETPDAYFAKLFDQWTAWSEAMAKACNFSLFFDNNAHTPELANSTQSV